MRRIIKNKYFKIIIIILGFVSVLSLWEFLIIFYDVPKRILPSPSSIIDYLLKDIKSGRYTLFVKCFSSVRDALLGFTLSTLLGSLLGIVFSQVSSFKSIFAPFTFIFQLLPVPAFAPVIASAFGYGLETKIIIIVLFTIFPVIVTVESAVERLSHSYLQLLATYNASNKEVIRLLLWPSIVPPLLTTMKILTTASIVTSIISELPLTVSGGIGKDIYNSFNNQIITRVWASLFLISLISLMFFYSVTYFEKNIMNKYRYGKE